MSQDTEMELAHAEIRANQEAERADEAEAKLSKALDLLKEAHIPGALHSDLDKRIDTFLTEIGK